MALIFYRNFDNVFDIEQTLKAEYDKGLDDIENFDEISNLCESSEDEAEIDEFKTSAERINIRRGESYIASPDWIASNKATINPKNEKDNECFKWSIIAGLNYNKVKKKELKKLLKFKRIDTDFSSHQRDWEKFEQENTSIAFNILFVQHNSEEIKLAYKSIYNKRKNQVILLMIGNQTNNYYYYFAVKKFSELNSSGWLMRKKEEIINGAGNHFQNALDDALNYLTIETHPQRISKLKPYINNYNWEGIDFPAGPKEWGKFERNNKTIALNVLYISHNTKNNKCCILIRI